VDVVDPVTDPEGFEALLTGRLGAPQTSVIVARRPCILAAADIRGYEKANASRSALPVMAAEAAAAALAAASPCGACAEEG